MKRLSVDFIAQAVEGKIIQGDTDLQIKGVSIDSRTINSEELFFAIRGENNDGHEFLDNAITNGANAVIVDRLLDIKENITVIKVNDTTKALQDLAKCYRSMLKNLKVVAITGSAGKTSTKDMIASLLNIKYKTKKTKGNLNNYYGLPLTILDFEGDEEVAVLEMGMSSLGEIELLCNIAKPDIGVITNVGEAHLETLGSIENVAKAKSELIEALSNDGIAVLNYDNKYVREMKNVFSGEEIIYYGLNSSADIYADEINNNTFEGVKYSLYFKDKKITMGIDRPGEHNVYNSLAAIAVAIKFGMTWEEIKKGFTKVEYSALRWDIRKSERGVTIINDTYNANPLSMKAVIEAVSSWESERIILVLGSMLELGSEEARAHKDLGQYIADKPVDLLMTVGKVASIIANGAENAGMNKSNIMKVGSNQEAVKYLKDFLKDNDVLLVKGSRGNKMEEIVEGLLD